MAVKWDAKRERWRSEAWIGGKRRRTFHESEREAQAEYRAARAEADAHRRAAKAVATVERIEGAARPSGAPESALTLGAVLDAYTHQQVTERRKPATRVSTEKSCRKLLAHFGEDFDVAALSPADVSSFKRAHSRLAAPTLRRHLVTLSGAVRHAREELELPDLGCRIQLPKVARSFDPRTIKRAELPGLLDAAEAEASSDAERPNGTPLLRAALAVAAYAGLRSIEVRHLQLDHLDLWSGDSSDHVLRVPRDVDKGGRGRVVPVVGPLRRELLDWLRVRPEETGWVFPSPRVHGEPVADLQHMAAAAFRRAGLYDTAIRPGFHCLRRLAASTFARTMTAPQLRDVMGWASVELAARYCEIAASDVARAAADAWR